jgi:hypothetical protein
LALSAACGSGRAGGPGHRLSLAQGANGSGCFQVASGKSFQLRDPGVQPVEARLSRTAPDTRCAALASGAGSPQVKRQPSAVPSSWMNGSACRVTILSWRHESAAKGM